MFEEIFRIVLPDFIIPVIKIFFGTSTIWLPIFLFGIFVSIWLRYVRTKSLLKNGGILLEIKLPRDVFKSPLAMEVILTSLFQTGGSNFYETYVKGKFRPWFSLELVSIEGEVHFYIWTQPKFRKLIESQFYSQYPGVEIFEAEDYTKKVFIDPGKILLWGANFKKKNKEGDVYPIKTYIDYGLDREQEEETKVDPMTSTLEFMGSLKAGEQVWFQILIQANRKVTLKDDAIFPTRPAWRKDAEAVIKTKVESLTKPASGETMRRLPTKGETEIVAALERSLGKLPFEVGMRGFYIARSDAFDPIGITGLIGSVRQYGSPSLNELGLAKTTDFEYPWQDFRRKRRSILEKKLLNAYKLRSYFQPPYQFALKTKPFMMNTEELATIFHLPGKVLATPTLTKIPSRKSEPPSNLPI